MGVVEDRLAELDITVPDVVPPVAAYLPAVRSGDLIWISGQLPVVDGELIAKGKVGAEIETGQAERLARLAALNAIAALKSEVGDLDQIERIVKVVGFVASVPTFTSQSLVVNGASDLLAAAFGDAGRHARSAVGVAALPLDAPVEIELVAKVR